MAFKHRLNPVLTTLSYQHNPTSLEKGSKLFGKR